MEMQSPLRWKDTVLSATYANSKVRSLVIRGISDLVEGKRDSDASGSQELAADHASAFAFEILATLDGVGGPEVTTASTNLASELTNAYSSNTRRHEPPVSRHHLIGRETELKQITDVLGSGNAILLHGLAGIGKSLLASEAARRLYSDGEVAGVLWIGAPSSHSIVALCDAIARELGDDETQSPLDSNGYSGIRRLLAAHLDLLLVVDDLALPEVGTTFINQCLPPHMSMIATSRRRHPVFVHDIQIQPLDFDSANVLFVDRAQLSSATKEVDDICSLLEGHPLALVIAAARHRVESMPIDNLHKRLADERSRLESLKSTESTGNDLTVVC